MHLARPSSPSSQGGSSAVIAARMAVRWRTSQAAIAALLLVAHIAPMDATKAKGAKAKGDGIGKAKGDGKAKSKKFFFCEIFRIFRIFL